MRLLLLATCLFSCARQPVPEVDNQSEAAALVATVLGDYSTDACIAPRSLTVPTMPLTHLTQSGLTAAAAEEIIAGIDNQSVHQWVSVVDQRVDLRDECPAVSYPIRYNNGGSAYILIADDYGQYEYLYQRIGTAWKLDRIISESIH